MEKLIFKPEFSGLVYPSTPTENFAVELMNAAIEMRRMQNVFFDLRGRQRLPISDARVQDALKESKIRESIVDELLLSVKKKVETPQYQLFYSE